MWLLTLNRDCRIFQNMTVPKVVKQILRQHKIGSFRESLLGKYRRWDCVTQYRESDFEFIGRILAHEGIYYYFEHSEKGHTLVLVDSLSSHGVHEDFDAVWLGRPSSNSSSPDYLETWQDSFEIQPDTVTLADFDFRLRHPSAEAERAPARGGGAEVRRTGDLRLPRPSSCWRKTRKTRQTYARRKKPGRTRTAGPRRGWRRGAARPSVTEGKGTARWLTTGFLFSIANSESVCEPAVSGDDDRDHAAQLAFHIGKPSSRGAL